MGGGSLQFLWLIMSVKSGISRLHPLTGIYWENNRFSNREITVSINSGFSMPCLEHLL